MSAITARFAGTCEACRGPIEVGQPIVPCAGVYGRWDHEGCGVAGAPRPPFDWTVVFTDGHEEHVETRLGYRKASEIAKRRCPDRRAASVRRYDG